MRNRVIAEREQTAAARGRIAESLHRGFAHLGRQVPSSPSIHGMSGNIMPSISWLAVGCGS